MCPFIVVVNIIKQERLPDSSLSQVIQIVYFTITFVTFPSTLTRYIPAGQETLF